MEPVTINPIRSKCQALVWSVEVHRALMALGINPASLVPELNTSAFDLRPQQFACPWARVKREDCGLYLVWRRAHVHGDADETDQGWKSSIYVGPPKGTDPRDYEQAAGDAVLQKASAGSGAHGLALRVWLEMWGWQPPQKKAINSPSPAMIT